MTFTSEAFVVSTSPRSEAIGETKMTVVTIGTTTFTQQSLVPSGTGETENN